MKLNGQPPQNSLFYMSTSFRTSVNLVTPSQTPFCFIAFLGPLSARIALAAKDAQERMATAKAQTV